jgi:gliding motility-associated lipoprotein GldD
MQRMDKILIILLFSGIVLSCNEKPIPKPKGFFRIEFQKKNYQTLPEGYPYQFDIPVYAIPVPDKSAQAEPWWINIDFPAHKAELHLSYKKIHGNLPVYSEESRDLAYEHSKKASSIEEKIFINQAGNVSGTIYYINGNAASPVQFYLTDSTRHFLRGALYISATPNIDSLKPVIEYLKTDIIRMIETLRWNN